MPHRFTISELRRRILLMSAAIVAVTGGSVLAVALIPIHSEERAIADQAMEHEHHLKAQAISHVLQRAADIARQVASRTVMGRDLQQFNDGQVSAANLEASTTPRLADAKRANADLMAIVRVDRRARPVSAVGEPAALENLPKEIANLKDVGLFGPVRIKEKYALVVGAPIAFANGRREGADVLFFDLDPLAAVLEDEPGTRRPYKTLVVVGNGPDRRVLGTPPEGPRLFDVASPFPLERLSFGANGISRSRLLGNDDQEYIALYSTVKDTSWSFVLYASVNAIYGLYVGKYIYAIMAMILLVVCGSIFSLIVIRPITGKMLISAHELEQEIDDRTKALKKEIEQRRLADEQVKYGERRFGDIVEGMDEWVWEIDVGGKCVYSSKRVVDVLGYTEQEILGKTAFETMDPAEAARIRPIFQDHVAKKASFRRLEHTNRRKDGTPVHLETTAFPLLSPEGDLLGFRGVDRDISDRKRAEAAIRESEALYRTAFHTSPDAVNINRLSDGLYVDINEGFTALTGYTREDAIGRSSLDINVWADVEDRNRLVRGLRERGSVENLEAQFRRKDGSLTTALMSARVITIGDEPHILSITRDISERKKAETVLQESEARSRLLLQGVSIGFGIDALDGRTLKANEGQARMLGFTTDELMAMRFTDYMDPDYVERDLALFREVASGQREGYQIEKPYITKDGRKVWGRVTRALVRDAQGRPEYCLSALEDITERKQLEESLTQREAQMSGILDASPAAIVLKDTERRYQMVNGAYCEFHGRAAETMIGRRAEEFQDPVQAEKTRREDARVLETGEPITFSETLRDPDGGERHFSLVKFPVWDRDHKMIGIGGVSIEVTREKRVENELRAAKERAEAANRAKTVFLANMSHELRTPLNSILGFAEVIMMEMFGPILPRYGEYVSFIRKSGVHLLGIINDILDMSRIDAEKVDLDIAPLDVGGVIDESIAFFDGMARENGVTIRKTYGLTPTIHADGMRLKQVIVNILSNAIKFSPRGTVTIGTGCGADGAWIVISDTGIGMTREDIELALQPFGQAEQSPEVRRFQGTGLGLPLAKRLVELHGGTLLVESVKGRGTTVTIRLPGRPEKRRGGADAATAVSAGGVRR